MVRSPIAQNHWWSRSGPVLCVSAYHIILLSLLGARPRQTHGQTGCPPRPLRALYMYSCMSMCFMWSLAMRWCLVVCAVPLCVVYLG